MTLLSKSSADTLPRPSRCHSLALAELPTHVGRDRFRVLRKLGQGGCSVVVAAFDRVLRVERALKILLPKRSQDLGARTRLANEARALAALRHPNVLDAFDLFEDPNVGGTLVLELARRGSVGQALRDNWRPHSDRIRSLMTALLSALEATHAEGLVHRDVKPDNCLLTEGGVMKLADFGVVLTEDSPSATPGVGMGTRRYSAPEQRVDASGVDLRADIWSAGATLLALCGVRVPLHLSRLVGREHRVWRCVSPGVAEVVRAACNPNPSKRFQSAAAMREAVRAFC